MSRIVCIGILLALAAPNARAACIGESQGALRELEALAFSQPAEAAKRVHRMLEAAPDTTASALDSRATLWALAAEAHRQRGQVQAALDAARAGLATLGVHPNADLKLRLQIAQALAMHAAHNGAQGLVELDRAIVGIKNPSRAAACIQKDRGWIRYSEGDIEGALRDLVSAYQQLQISGPESERMVTAARLATVYASAREYDQATSLLNETLNYFVTTGAQGRLPTTYDRLGRVYAAQKKFGEAIDAFEKMRHHASLSADTAAMAYADIRMCGVQIDQGLFAAAAEHCDAAGHGLLLARESDREERRILLAYQARINLASGNASAAIEGFDASLAGDPAELSKNLRAQFHLWRADALAATGQFRQANADIQEYLQRGQVINESETASQIAVLRVRFATGREIEKNALLQKDNALKQQRLSSEQRTSQMWSAVATAAAAMILALAYVLWNNRNLRHELLLLAERDDLTLLPNRRKILLLAHQQYGTTTRLKRSFSIAVIDLDNFKQLNDRFGHACGDAALAAFSAAALELIRDDCVIGRYGGEEFLVVLPGTTLPQARVVMERVRTAVSELRLSAPFADVRLTLSAGISELDARDQSVESIIRRADAALYAAKRAGRDRIADSGVT